jgi:aminoglycoside phosphotransferase (APT) family kinase protein
MFIYDIKVRIPIDKGWSSDKKYCVTTSNGKKYLLRLSKLEKSENREIMFKMMEQVSELGVPICRPLEFGYCDEGVYSLQAWIEGSDAELVIPKLSEREQYNYGMKAGKFLKMIHKIPAPSTQEEWEPRFNRKIDNKIKMYLESLVKYKNGHFFLDYIKSNRYLLKNRPQTFQHGDYHIGNMMIDNKKELKIIDFDRWDYGDPWEEFNRVVFCVQKAPLFASGMVNGYFNDDVPLELWKLLALYISVNALSSIVWASAFGQEEIDNMNKQAKEIICWYNNMENIIPTWYVRNNREGQ